MDGLIPFDGFKFKIGENNCCELELIDGNHDHLVVPSFLLASKGKRYKVNKISRSIVGGTVNTISFAKLSGITEVPLCFVRECKSVFYLPPKIK